MRFPIHDHIPAYKERLLGDSSGDSEVPLSLKLCNYSSCAFYIVTLFYACFIFHKLVFKNERSKSLMTAIAMLMYSSLSLAILFALSNLDFYQSAHWSME